jgi:hypothetical protein
MKATSMMTRALLVCFMCLIGCGGTTPESSASQAPRPTPTPSQPAPSTAPIQIIRMSDDSFDYVVDFARGEMTSCRRGASGECERIAQRAGESFEPYMRASLLRLARESRSATCADGSGPTIRLDIDGSVQAIVLPPYPEDRDYMPPDDNEPLTECAPRALARTITTFLAWE